MTEPSADQRKRLRDFAFRAEANLEFIERYVAKNPRSTEVFEVTQLLTSLLWLVGAANEWLDIDEVPIDDLYAVGCPHLEFTGSSAPATLSELTNFLRNAITHLNIDIHGAEGSITDIVLWNHRRGRLAEAHTADLRISVSDLRRLAKVLPERYGLLGPERQLRIRSDRL
jgi:hypothetical protein